MALFNIMEYYPDIMQEVLNGLLFLQGVLHFLIPYLRTRGVVKACASCPVGGENVPSPKGTRSIPRPAGK